MKNSICLKGCCKWVFVIAFLCSINKSLSFSPDVSCASESDCPMGATCDNDEHVCIKQSSFMQKKTRSIFCGDSSECLSNEHCDPLYSMCIKNPPTPQPIQCGESEPPCPGDRYCDAYSGLCELNKSQQKLQSALYGCRYDSDCPEGGRCDQLFSFCMTQSDYDAWNWTPLEETDESSEESTIFCGTDEECLDSKRSYCESFTSICIGQNYRGGPEAVFYDKYFSFLDSSESRFDQNGNIISNRYYIKSRNKLDSDALSNKCSKGKIVLYDHEKATQELKFLTKNYIGHEIPILEHSNQYDVYSDFNRKLVRFHENKQGQLADEILSDIKSGSYSYIVRKYDFHFHGVVLDRHEKYRQYRSSMPLNPMSKRDFSNRQDRVNTNRRESSTLYVIPVYSVNDKKQQVIMGKDYRLLLDAPIRLRLDSKVETFHFTGISEEWGRIPNFQLKHDGSDRVIFHASPNTLLELRDKKLPFKNVEVHIESHNNSNCSKR